MAGALDYFQDRKPVSSSEVEELERKLPRHRRQGKKSRSSPGCFLQGQGADPAAAPLVEFIEQARQTVSTVLEQVSQQTIETILELTAEQVAGLRKPGRPRGEIRWHRKQPGRVSLEERRR